MVIFAAFTETLRVVEVALPVNPELPSKITLVSAVGIEDGLLDSS